MPIPEPRPDEKREDFISRCMEEVTQEVDDQDQALAICFEQWRKGAAADASNIIPFPGPPPAPPRPAANHPGFTRFGPVAAAKGERRAEILIYEEIGDWFGGLSAKVFAEELKKLGPVDEIIVGLNSPGGSVFDGIAVYNLLRQHGAQITTRIDGIAASIASVIYVAGDRRLAAANATYMLHQPWTIAAGNAEELRAQADILDNLAEGLRITYGRATGLPGEEVQALMDAESWFTAEQATELGFIHELIEEAPIAAAANIGFDLSRFQHPPDHLSNRVLATIARGEHKDRVNREKLTRTAEAVRAFCKEQTNDRSQNRRAPGGAGRAKRTRASAAGRR